ncbi:MAG TPA: sulfur oxidation c-type cytochrome SoxA [Burkholderiaceae bacterium]|nr:sulfur oxidation c-type cytochrome SoxA [Burkholderiaceae bacterium]
MKRAMVGLAIACVSAMSYAQTDTQAEIEKYRQLLQDGNPAELVEAAGEELWKTPRGPNKVSLERCDLGLGPGVVKGAYARLPRYFADVDRVMDFESRLVHCMVTLQGFNREDLVKKPFAGAGEPQTDLEKLTTYVVTQSRGVTIAVPQGHPKEIASFERGRKIFFYRAGPYDFSCASCHGVDGQRIRLQELPNLTDAAKARKAFASWPAYRVSQGTVRTMEWRLYDCFRQQRFPELKYLSDAAVDLTTFLGVQANGGTMESPSIKR